MTLTPPTTSYSWTDIWTASVTRPHPDTYTTLLQDTNTRPRRAFFWMYVTGIVLALVTYNIVFSNADFQAQVTQAVAQSDVSASAGSISQVLLLLTLCATPFAAAFNVLLYALLSLAIHTVAQRTANASHVERHANLFYLMGAVIAPLTVVSAIATILPDVLGFGLSLAVMMFQTYCFVQIVRTVYLLDVRQAVLAAAVPTVLFYVLQWLVVGALV